MKKSKNKTIWLEQGIFTSFMGFCPSEKAWKKTMKKLKIKKESWFKKWDDDYPQTDGCCTEFTMEDGRNIILVTLSNTEYDTRENHVEVVGLIAHEATHVYQKLLENMGEVHRPSPEYEAYTIQFITQRIYEAFLKSRT